MKKGFLLTGCIILILILISVFVGAYTDTTIQREKRLSFEHVMRISDINLIPNPVPPGKSAVLELILENTAEFDAADVRVNLNLPDEIGFSDDVSEKKIGKLTPGEHRKINYSLIILPDASERVYDGDIIIKYLNGLGDERQDNNSFSIIVKGNPSIFSQIDNSEIYKGNYVGSITIKFVNNGIGDAKFLTIELLESDDYDIISSNKEYIGDLDSDDFESVDFRIELKNKKNPTLLLKASYKDSLNEDYSQEFGLPLELRSAEELGIDTNGTTYTVLIIILIVIVSYFVYKRYRKKKKIITSI